MSSCGILRQVMKNSIPARQCLTTALRRPAFSRVYHAIILAALLVHTPLWGSESSRDAKDPIPLAWTLLLSCGTGLALVAWGIYHVKRKDRHGETRSRSERIEMHALATIGGLLIMAIYVLVGIFDDLNEWMRTGEKPTPLILLTAFWGAVFVSMCSGTIAWLRPKARQVHIVLAVVALAVTCAVILFAS